MQLYSRSRLFHRHLESLCVVALWLIAASPAIAAEETASREVYQRLSAASLELIVTGTLTGTAVVVDEQGLALTAAHGLLDHPDEVEVVEPDGNRQKAEVLAVDLSHDLALLQLPERDFPYPFVPLAPEAPQAGDTLYLYGTPLFRRPMMQEGMAADGRPGYEFYPNFYTCVEICYVSGDAQPGTSGGPWANARGELAGIQLSIMGGPTSPMGVAMIAPLAAMQALVQEQENVGLVTIGAGYEELWEHPPEITKRYPVGSQGLVLRQIQPGGPVNQVGLEEWDLVTEVDGQPVRRVWELAALLYDQPSDTVLTFTVISPDEPESREVELPLAWLQWNRPQPAIDSSENLNELPAK